MLRHGVGREEGEEVADLLQSFIGPLEQWLDRQTDRRLVRTFFLTLVAIVRLRHSRSGLLLSELGAHILSPAPAGTKRLSILLRSSKWSHTLLDEFLRQRAEQSLPHLERRDELALAIWDESVLEKPESIALEGLCPVRSSKAARLKRIKPGYYNPPGGPLVFVPGLQWLTVMLAVRLAVVQGTPSLAAMRWWTSRGQLACHRREQTASLLFQCAQWWQRRVVHVFDRGFAGAPWLRELGGHQLRFILRWPTRYHLADDRGERPTWHITRGKRSQDHREIWDLHRRQYRKTGIEHRHRGRPGAPSPTGRCPVAGGLPPRQGAQTLVPAYQRANSHPRRCLAGGAGLCLPLAGGDVLPGLQD